MSKPLFLALVVVTAALHVDPARACGGLFCDTVQPVNQVGEQIVFVDHGDGRVTAVVQISYTGPSETFAWVLPVVGVPEIGVSSNLAFTRLRSVSDPLYSMTTEIEGECATPAYVPGCAQYALAGDGGDGDGDAPEDATGGNITVLDQGSVGPYNYVIIQVNPELPDLAEEALQWLETNGYQAGALGPDLIRPYLEETMNLVAFRLEKNADSGDIRPVVLTYSDLDPMIPIKLTAVAAEDDMGVLVWVTGASRAVPTNYLSLVPNDALLNWFAPMSNYNDLITAAADEAGGQGFVTEHVTTTASLAGTIWTQSDEETWANIEADPGPAPPEVASRLLSRYANWDGVADALREAGVPPADAAAMAGCPFCGVDDAAFTDVTIEGLLAAWDANVLEPLRATEALFVERPYVTRLYSTLSAPEMTLDPAFGFNADLGDVENVHTASRVIHCDASVTFDEAPWSTELPSGEVVFGSGFSWPVDFDDPELPKNRLILEDSTSGQPIVVTNNATSIRARLEALNEDVVPSAVTRGCAVVRTRGRGPGELAMLLGVVIGWRAMLRRARR